MTSRRVASIDIFRGLTMLLMIFVNDLASVRGLPWWNYHLHAAENGMTYVDMVFPTFLFIVGLSIPLAIKSRLEKGSTQPQLWIHILSRSAGLLVLGIALANADQCISMPSNFWGFLVLVSGILFWITYPKLKYVGLAGLIILFAIFRREGGHWLDFSYWEILGLIGWSYLAVCLLYVPTRRWKFAPLVFLILLPKHEYGTFCSLIFAGIIATQILLTDDFFKTASRRFTASFAYAALLLIAGILLLPFGISKIRATPTWCFFSAAAAMLIFILLHYLCDVKEKTTWAGFVKPAGSNTILTYLLPDLYYFGVAIPWLPSALDQGLPGAVKAAVFTLLMLAISALLTRWKIRMQL